MTAQFSARRWIILTAWVGTLAALLLLVKDPVARLYDIVRTAVRLSHEELHPPLLVPVAGVPRSALYDSWGTPRGGGRRHEGIDIFAPCGTPVLSATEGIVGAIGHNTLGGQVVWVLGPGLTWHYYAHLSRYGEIRRGDHVHSGDIVGYVGKTGNAATTPCHLHYGIYRQSHPEDPYPFLTAKEGSRK